LEAASVATEALNAALRSALGGQNTTDAAERAARDATKRKTREARSAAWQAERAAEESSEGQARREDATRVFHERAAHAVDNKAERLEDIAATRRAEREERSAAAASRRCLSEARARFGGVGKRQHLGVPSSELQQGCSDADIPSFLIDDPFLSKARALCKGAASIVAQLDEQNDMLRRKTFGKTPEVGRVKAPAPPTARAAQPAAPGVHASRLVAAHAAVTNAEEQQLLAKAKELLADYRPQEKHRKVATPSSSLPNSPVAAGSRGGRVTVETIGRPAPRGR
jgi:hypothetical protein